MPHIPPLSDPEATGQAQNIFQGLQSVLKMVPNIFRTMGHSPAVLKATLDLDSAIKHDLDPKLRELAYLKASQLNRCGYCQHYHTNFGKKAGVTEVQFQDLERYEQSNAFSDLEKTVLRFTEQWTVKGKADAEVVRALTKGLSPAQVVVLAATVGLANWTNRFNETFAIELP
jgi:AhpD family alkylhydroperoxidase